MNFQIWLTFCLFFLIFNLKLLFDDYYLFNYMIVDKNDKLYLHSTKFLFCIEFNYIKLNDKLINENITNKKVSAIKFINYAIKSIEFNLNSSNLFQLNQSFIFYNSICFLIDKKEFETDKPLNGLLEYYEFVWLYANPYLVHPIYSDQIYHKGSIDSHFYNLKIRRQIIYDHNYLKNSNCLNDKLLTKINCINHCFDLINYQYGFYNYLDEHKFNLSLITNNKRRLKRETDNIKLIGIHNFLGKDKYDKLNNCFSNCQKNYCHYEIYNSIQIFNNKYKTPLNKIIELETSIYLAYYLINDFWLQLIGLICLIIGNSLYNLIIYFNYHLFNQLKSLFKFRIDNKLIKFLIYYFKKYFNFIKFKLICLLILLLIILIQSLILFKEYDYKLKFPNRTTYFNYSTNLPSLIICFPIQLLMFNQYDFKLDNHILSNYTFKEIEKKTKFNQSKLIKKFEFTYASRIKSLFKKEIKFIINNNEIYFKGNRHENIDHNYVIRCFRIELIYLNKLRYEYLNPIHYLEIEFKTLYWNLFLIDNNQNLTINSTELKEGHSFRKIEISQKSKCNNLKDNKMIRINRCINKKFIEQFNSVSIYTLINKNELINLSIDHLKFNVNRSNYNEIENECLNKFNYLIDCNQIKYKETFKKTQSFNCKKIRINLNYENYYEYEFEQSITKLILSILDLISITLGITVIGLLSFLNKLIKFKLIKILIILICLIGFFIHNLFIFKGIIDEKLSYSIYFEKLIKYKLPNILICIDLDKELMIDHNYKFTPNYLNKLTNKLNLEKIFYFVYFNKTNINFFEPINNINSFNNEIFIDTLYFLNFKCFEIRLEIEFDDNDLYVTPNKYFLYVSFNPEFIGNSKLIYILYRHSNSNQFSDLLKYKIKYYNNSDNNYTSYSVIFELIEINKEDHFELLKNPISLLYGTVNLDDTTSYLNKMRDEFKELTNSTTREILLENNNFNLEINEDLFKQYYLQIQNYTDHNYPKSSNLKQNYYNSQTDRRYFWDPVISFAISSRKKKIKITNQDNYAKLILNLLNTLSLWLDICVLDLYKYFTINSFKFILLFYPILIRLKIKLNNIFSVIILD